MEKKLQTERVLQDFNQYEFKKKSNATKIQLFFLSAMNFQKKR